MLSREGDGAYGCGKCGGLKTECDEDTFKQKESSGNAVHRSFSQLRHLLRIDGLGYNKKAVDRGVQMSGVRLWRPDSSGSIGPREISFAGRTLARLVLGLRLCG